MTLTDRLQRLRRTRLQRVRESVVPLADGHAVYVQDDQTVRDAADLYAALPEDHDTGSPNLENAIARGLLESLQRAGTLSPAQLAKLRQLLTKHRDKIEALRASPDRQGQDPMNEPDPNRANLVR